ncbi:hypothetical protein [Ornithinibacillus halophilus]|uniref:Uncharacterized protein n=1 Tax=Ornithinibacillus halophilus TaxID=930117 RepID=A0A1M5JZG4_9BACI|nr:hypothetical protein [Ornithinibacillus halophilus]SHG45775.1 hypothetical protein SAMN05216225_103429 [Ornithinibacillus halophilus]
MRLNKKLLGFSVILCILITTVVPSSYSSEGMGKYVFGFPFNNITFYQKEPTSMWFATNFFTGNNGLSINPLSFLLNIFIFY